MKRLLALVATLAVLLTMPRLAHAVTVPDYCTISTSVGLGTASGNASWCSLTSTSPFTVVGPTTSSNLCVLSGISGKFHVGSNSAPLYDDSASVMITVVSGVSRWQLNAYGAADHVAATMTCVPFSKFTSYSGGFGYVYTALASPGFIEAQDPMYGWPTVNADLGNATSYAFAPIDLIAGKFDNIGDYLNVSLPGTGDMVLTAHIAANADTIFTSSYPFAVSGGIKLNVTNEYEISAAHPSVTMITQAQGICGIVYVRGQLTDNTEWLGIWDQTDGSQTGIAGTSDSGTVPYGLMQCVYY